MTPDGFEGTRIEYTRGKLLRSDLPSDPFELLREWLKVAEDSAEIEPSAMALATVSEAGYPSSRMVLLRGIDETGVVFFTNYASRKGRDIEATRHVAATLFWPSLQRQVRLEGDADRTSEKESDDYFANRPYESQLASAASRQSQPLTSEAEIETRIEELRQEHPLQVPRPSVWGGYHIYVREFEFWQGGPSRLHDRFRYRLQDGEWTIERLSP